MKSMFNFVLKNFELFYQTYNLSIDYLENNDSKLRIKKSKRLDFFKKKIRLDINKVIWKEWKGVSIPFFFDDESNVDIITTSKGITTINYDIIASCFYLLSGWDEYTCKEKDLLGRVSFEKSVVKELRIIHIPVVNYYYDILFEAILAQQLITKKNLWGKNKFGVALTHDIDKLNRGWLEGSLSELKKYRFLSIPKLIIRRLLNDDVWFNLKKISELEKSKGAKSTFFFLPSKQESNGLTNADYSISSGKVQRNIKYLLNRGNEVGIHGSFGSHINEKQFKDEIQKIETDKVIGNRFHYLMFDLNRTTSIMESAGVKYDSTIGFAEHVGFRRGTCYPFYLYNFEINKVSSVLEIPLLVMDTTLSSKKYMNISTENALIEIEKLLREVEKFNGVLTVLWHNNYFSKYKYSGWKEVYLNILDLCNERSGWLTSGEEIYKKINE